MSRLTHKASLLLNAALLTLCEGSAVAPPNDVPVASDQASTNAFIHLFTVGTGRGRRAYPEILRAVWNDVFAG